MTTYRSKPRQVRQQSEVEVTKDVVGFLQGRGWIADRVQVGVFLTKYGSQIRIGRTGQPDWRFKHPRLGYMEVEMKATGEKPRPKQDEYLATMFAMGFRNHIWTDNLEGFKAWYFETMETAQACRSGPFTTA